MVVIVEDEEMVPAFSSYTAADAGSGGISGAAATSTRTPAEAPRATPAAPVAAPATQFGNSPSITATSGRKLSTPYARKLAQKVGIDISGIQGSGPSGRIVAVDVDQAVSAGGSAVTSGHAFAEFTEEAIKQVQKVTAKRLLESKTMVPHYYLTYECQVDKLLSLRKQLNEHLEDSRVKLSVNDFMIKASAAALRAVPDVNSSWRGEHIRRYHNVDVSVAVQTPVGLMVPVVRDADLKGLQTISEDVKLLASKVRSWSECKYTLRSCIVYVCHEPLHLLCMLVFYYSFLACQDVLRTSCMCGDGWCLLNKIPRTGVEPSQFCRRRQASCCLKNILVVLSPFPILACMGSAISLPLLTLRRLESLHVGMLHPRLSWARMVFPSRCVAAMLTVTKFYSSTHICCSCNGCLQVMVMNVTMSCDHRVVDGAVGASWLQAFKSLIENPERLLL